MFLNRENSIYVPIIIDDNTYDNFDISYLNWFYELFSILKFKTLVNEIFPKYEENHFNLIQLGKS